MPACPGDISYQNCECRWLDGGLWYYPGEQKHGGIVAFFPSYFNFLRPTQHQHTPAPLRPNEITSVFEVAFFPWSGKSSSEEMLVCHPVFPDFSCHNLRLGLQIKNDLVEMKDTLWAVFPIQPEFTLSCSSAPQMSQIVPHKANGLGHGFWRPVAGGVSLINHVLQLPSCVALGKWLDLSESSKISTIIAPSKSSYKDHVR